MEALFTTAQRTLLCFSNNLTLTGSLQEPVEKVTEIAAVLKRSQRVSNNIIRIFLNCKDIPTQIQRDNAV